MTPAAAAPPSLRLSSAHIGMKVGTIPGLGDKAGADGEFAEALALLAAGCIGREHWSERGRDAVMIEILGVKLGQARAVEGRSGTRSCG